MNAGQICEMYEKIESFYYDRYRQSSRVEDWHKWQRWSKIARKAYWIAFFHYKQGMFNDIP